MKINFEELGYREKMRLLNFAHYVEHKNKYTEHDLDYGYNPIYDEPYFEFAEGRIYATDYNVAFNTENEIEEI